MIILDTNVISETLRPSPYYNVINWLNEKDNDDLYLSAIVLAELFSGVACMPDGKRQRDLKLKLADALELKFEGQILPFDGLCAMQYAELTARNRLLGKAMSVPDAQIAATLPALRRRPGYPQYQRLPPLRHRVNRSVAGADRPSVA